MFVNADIQVTSSNVMAVPDEAVVHSGNREYIFVQRKSGQFALVPVKTGVSQNGFTAITDPGNDLVDKVIIIKKGLFRPDENEQYRRGRINCAC